jgi:uncharacterized caspase-like protein
VALFVTGLTCVCAFGVQAKAQVGKHALIIGINDYRHSYAIPDLRFAQADAEALQGILEDRGFTVHLLTSNQATTRNSIVAELNRYARVLSEDDIFILFFAGHGARRETNGKTYWLAYDANVQELDVNGIRLDHLMDYVNDIPARSKLVLLDHCYAGDVNLRASVSDRSGSAGRGPGDDARGLERGVFRVEDVKAELEKPRNLTVIAGARNEAYEDSTLGHGVFTQALIEALGEGKADGVDIGADVLGEDGRARADGRIDVSELIEYTRSRVFAIADTAELADKGLTQEVISHSVFTNAADFEVVTLSSDNITQEEIDSFMVVLGKWAGENNVLEPDIMVVCMEVLTKKSAGQELTELEEKVLEKISTFVALGGPEAKVSAGRSLNFAIAGLVGSQ